MTLIKYFYIEDGEQRGPITIEEFINKGLNGNVLVWCEGMIGWTPASEVEEIRDALSLSTPPPSPANCQGEVPPPFHSTNTGHNPRTQGGPEENQFYSASKEPTNYMVYAILATILCCIPTGIASIVYANKANTSWAAGRYKESLEATKNARLWLIITVCVGAFSIIISFMFGLFTSLLG